MEERIFILGKELMFSYQDKIVFPTSSILCDDGY